MIHAAVMGSIERFLSVLIEHYAGAFPVWLSPVQVAILPISDSQNQWADKVAEELEKTEIRYEINNDSDTLGKKIRNSEMQKTPYLLILGEKEAKSKKVAVRQRSKGDIGQMNIDEFIGKIRKEVENKK